MLEQYKSRLEAFHPVSDERLHDAFTGETHAYTLHDTKGGVKKSIKESNGKMMWKGFTNLKSDLVNHWLSHFSIQSRWDIGDTVKRVRMHAWTYWADKNMQNNNRKAELEGHKIKLKRTTLMCHLALQ